MIKSILLAALSTVLVLLAHAAFASTLSWDQLVDAAVHRGTVHESPVGTYRSLERLSADRRQPHTANYFSAVGYDGRDGFEIFRFEVVSENWLIDAEGNWVIDQWGFVLSPEGRLQRWMCYRLVETPQGLVLEQTPLPATVDEANAAWAARLAEWQNP